VEWSCLVLAGLHQNTWHFNSTHQGVSWKTVCSLSKHRFTSQESSIHQPAWQHYLQFDS
jgi:hypothetical protein